MELCILIPTCERHKWVANFTYTMITRYWKNHPPVYFCGTENAEGGEWLKRQDPEKDWIGILFTACHDLMSRGYSKCYLILDDHPPIKKCSGGHLNNTIPNMMTSLDAVYIGLNGWGQGREPNGKILGAKYYSLENVSEDFAWKYSLHPGLWDIAALGNILSALMKQLPVSERTSWAFERKGGVLAIDIPSCYRKRSYRICGQCMTESYTGKILRIIEWYIYRAVQFVSVRALGDSVQKRVDLATVFLRRYYEGPYPLFWSGLLTKGRPNSDMLRYLRSHGRVRFLRELRKADKATH